MHEPTTRNGVILMTALPPTIGHLALINFADSFLSTFFEVSTNLFVIVNTRSIEPHQQRALSLIKAVRPGSCFIITDEWDDAPQNPEDHPDFWNVWKDRVTSVIQSEAPEVTLSSTDFLFASELYGIQLAEVLGLRFIPYDINREIVPAKATHVRQDVLECWDQLVPAMQLDLRQTVTIFGAESCGKTTMAKRLAHEFVGVRGQPLVATLPEWARPYLETVGAEVTAQKMDDIMRGQWAIQCAADKTPTTPFLVMDTDLLSTIGYFRIMGLPVPDDILMFFHVTKSNLYILMNSNIPFEQDPLRYGGTVRESTDEFWIGLLEEFKCNYHVVSATDPNLQYDEVKNVIVDCHNQSMTELKEFVRT